MYIIRVKKVMIYLFDHISDVLFFLAFFYLVKGHSMTRRNQVPVKCAGCNEKVVKSYRCVMRTEAPSHIKPLFAQQPGEMLRICRKCVKKKEIGNGKSSS